jgi:polyhydroxyalkanoate synthesis regulator phasin
LAIEILNLLAKHAVGGKRVKSELIKTGKFSREEAENFLKEATAQGIVYQDENGYYIQN